MLTLHDVRVHYGAIQAVKGISLEVRERELVTIVGANGAGKTTTLRTISGIYRPTTGSITFEGRNLAVLPSHEIVALGISQAPEGRQIFGSLSVRDNLMLGATRRADRASIAQELDYLVSLFPVLGERMNQSGGTLSGGEQQMLAIARALMAKPRLLLLDEPSLGLAPMLVNRIFAVISRLKETGVTILLVEQNARKALEIADRAYVMETGRVILGGDARELAANPEIEKAYLGG
ncbi:MAG: amino acid/amide transporter ATP-binding protein 2, family [Thermomicrobiales bacterium]|nr:amino acid/amide transporter ATP-binding protein 2, family [Thermomicrobiales bacterium]MDF3015486.1 amino acid/amide transporter ATP-binding protein 2, family [Thermomicrobiales bacterium]